MIVRVTGVHPRCSDCSSSETEALARRDDRGFGNLSRTEIATTSLKRIILLVLLILGYKISKSPNRHFYLSNSIYLSIQPMNIVQLPQFPANFVHCLPATFLNVLISFSLSPSILLKKPSMATAVSPTNTGRSSAVYIATVKGELKPWNQ